MACTDTENSPQPGDTENVLLRKLLNRLCNVTSGGGGGVSQAYVDARDAATLASANANAVAGDVATLAAAMSSASALYVLKSGDTMTGALLQPAGSVGAPALSRSGDTDTGIWYPAANTWAISTAGAERVRVDSAGNVGIGTTSPGQLLEVFSAGEASAVLNFGAASGGGVYFKEAGTSRFLVAVDGSVVNNPFYIYDYASGAKVFNINNGLVGIGIEVALAKLHVKPSASGTDYFRIDHSDGTPRWQFGAPSFNTVYAGMWGGNLTPSDTNFAIVVRATDQTYINGVTTLFLATGGTGRWTVDATGHFLAGTDNTYDIGASGANRPRNIYSVNDVNAGYRVLIGSAGAIYGPSAGVFTILDADGSSLNRLQLGGTTSSFPAIKRSSATLQARLADDSAFADVSVASIRTNNAAALVISSVAMNDGAAAALGTLTDAPVAGNPTKWIPIDDNGTIRYIPAW